MVTPTRESASLSRPSSPSTIFPERLRSAREYRGLTQRQLAAKCGLQPSAISHFETGTRKPSFDNLHRLAETVDVTIDYLLGRVAQFKSLSGMDRLHRHYEQLAGSDRKLADDLITMLAARAKDKAK
jgi:transcriptional regulator with XRE-family HTH domain